jgi:uncharacterized membrane protein YphA (DoxX/SURF4 family)
MDCPSPEARRKKCPLGRILALSRPTCQYLLAIVFLMAAVGKIIDLNGFKDRLILRMNLPPVLATAVASFLPWLELTCGFGLLIGVAVREAAFLVALLILLFFVYGILHYGQEDCGCFMFSSPNHSLPWWPLARDAVLFVCSARVAWPHSRSDRIPF